MAALPARGIRRQHGHSAWEIHAGAVILAAGGTAFLSGLLGSRNNTGDGYLMAAEAGAELSGMEFTAAFTIAPARSNMTRTMSYSFATYYDVDGRELDAPPYGAAQTRFLARALQDPSDRITAEAAKVAAADGADVHRRQIQIPAIEKARATSVRPSQHKGARDHIRGGLDQGIRRAGRNPGRRM